MPEGIHPSDIGVHSIRKGAAAYACIKKFYHLHVSLGSFVLWFATLWDIGLHDFQLYHMPRLLTSPRAG
jgi:hypothetical protein